MRLYQKVALMAATCFISAPYLFAAIPAGYAGKPFCCDTLLGHPQGIPGIVKGVFFDSGGEGVGFHDGDNGNQGGSMRLKNGQQIQADFAVDMQSYSGNDWDVVGYGTSGQHDSSVTATPLTWHISWINASGPTSAGDWYKHTVHVNVAGTYTIDLKEAEAYAPPSLQLITFYNGASTRTDSIKDLPMCITPPGCPEVWHAWNCFMNVDTVTLDTGLQVVQMAFVTGSWNYDWMRFRLKGASPVLSGVKNGFAQKAFDVRPVITGTNLTVSYSLAQAGRTTVAVYDCAGRAMVPSIARTMNAGAHKQIVGLGNMGHGVYFVRVEQNGLRETKSFTVTH
jgi:hypothetical protein